MFPWFFFLTIFIEIWELQENLCIESLFSEKPDKKFYLHLQAFGTIKESDRIQKNIFSFSLSKGAELGLFCDSLPQGKIIAAIAI